MISSGTAVIDTASSRFGQSDEDEEENATETNSDEEDGMEANSDKEEDWTETDSDDVPW